MFERISVNAEICGGKPCIKGGRIMVKNIIGMISGGYTVSRILEEYPELEEADVIEALEYAAYVVDDEKVLARICAP